jgi:hypothetical protein
VVRRLFQCFACGLIGLSAVFAFQRPFRQFDGVEYSIGDVPLPSDYQEKTEWAFARLMYPPGPLNGYRYRDLDWHIGVSLWTQDFPRADRHFSLAVRRLTRIHVRSVEQPVNLDEGDAYDWPWLYAVQVGEWGLTGGRARNCASTCCAAVSSWPTISTATPSGPNSSRASARLCPNFRSARSPMTIPFFTPSTISPIAIQVPGEAHLRAGYKSNNGPSSRGAHWRGIYDSQGRIIVAISYNSDIGDAWEYADDPYYPAKFADLAIRLGVNYIVYSMTH